MGPYLLLKLDESIYQFSDFWCILYYYYRRCANSIDSNQMLRSAASEFDLLFWSMSMLRNLRHYLVKLSPKIRADFVYAINLHHKRPLLTTLRL